MPSFEDILPTSPPAYIPPSFSDFNVLPDTDLPDGGTEAAPTTDSVKIILPASTKEREYSILNRGSTIVRLFFGGTAAAWQSNLETPYLLISGRKMVSDLATCTLPVFGWSEGGTNKLIVGVFE